MRGLEDRMKFFEQQVLRHMAQLANTVSKKNAAQRVFRHAVDHHQVT